MRISGAVVLITGASEGIGAACAAEFRRRGARIALAARTESNLRAAAGPEDLVLPADLTIAEERRRVFHRTLEKFGRIDILVNNAGVGLAAPAWSARFEDVRHLYELNFFAALELTQLAVENMKARGSGMIVNIGSVAGKVAMPWFTLYSSTKFALAALTSGLRMEMRKHGIGAMLVCPGFVRTQFHAHSIGGPPAGATTRGRLFEVTPEHCAMRIADGVQRNSRTIVTPRAAWMLVAASRLFPDTTDRFLANLIREPAV